MLYFFYIKHLSSSVKIEVDCGVVRAHCVNILMPKNLSSGNFLPPISSILPFSSVDFTNTETVASNACSSALLENLFCAIN